MKRFSRAFALPTVLITSLVMLSVLAVAVQVVATAGSTLGAQNYNQMAQAAAQAGAAYAQSCMASHSNQVTWSDAKPLMPNTDCSGNVSPVCPSASTDTSCWVMQNSQIQTTFKVGAPVLAGDGSLLQINSVGSASQLRQSDGSVWRTYTQTATQRYSNSCIATAQNTPGWQTPAIDQTSISSTQSNWSGPTTASINQYPSGASSLAPGPTWYRKDFTATISGTYTLDTMADNRFVIYIDGQPVADNRTVATSTSINTMSSVSITLAPGCHSLTAQVMNTGVTSSASWLALALLPPSSSTPLVSTDTTWRATTGATVPLTASNYYADPTSWIQAKNFGAYTVTTTPWGGTSSVITNWTNTTHATDAEWIGTPDGSDGSSGYGNYPASSYADFLDNQTVTVTTATPVTVYAQFDDIGYIYLDGQQIGTGGGWSTLQSFNVTLQPGTHHFGVILGNTTSGSSAFLFAVTRTSDNAILTESNHNWVTNDSWSTGSPVPQSLASDYVPALSPTLNDTVTNLVTNPSFETNANGMNPVNATVTADGTHGINGSFAMKLAPTGNTDSYAVVPLSTSLVAGRSYTVSAVVHTDTALVGPLKSDDSYLSVVVVWNGAIQAQVGAANIGSNTYQIHLPFTIPTGATGISIRLYDGSSTSTDYVYWDSIMVTAGPMQYPYRDGNSAGWTWSGTANLSTSSGPIPVGASS